MVESLVAVIKEVPLPSRHPELASALPPYQPLATAAVARSGAALGGAGRGAPLSQGAAIRGGFAFVSIPTVGTPAGGAAHSAAVSAAASSAAMAQQVAAAGGWQQRVG